MIPFAPLPAWSLSLAAILAGAVAGWAIGRAWPRRRWWADVVAGVGLAFGGSGLVTVAVALLLGGSLNVEPRAMTTGPWLLAAVAGTTAAEAFLAAYAGLVPRWPRGVSRQDWLFGLVAGPAFVLISGLWVTMLDALGVAPEGQLVAEALMTEAPWVAATALVSVTLLAPVLEEAVFRGWLLPALCQSGRPRLALVVQALAFGAMHLDAPWLVPPLCFIGLVCGYLRLRSGSLGPAILAHLGNNAIAAAVLLGSAASHPG